MGPASPVKVVVTADAVLVSHAKDATGPVLRFTRGEWAEFLETFRDAAPVLPWSTPEWATFATCAPAAVRRLPAPWADPAITEDRPPPPPVHDELMGRRYL